MPTTVSLASPRIQSRPSLRPAMAAGPTMIPARRLSTDYPMKSSNSMPDDHSLQATQHLSIFQPQGSRLSV